MQEIFFNSRSELDRLPCGAVTAGTTIRIGIRISSKLGIKKATLILHKDSDGFEKNFPLSLVWSESGYDRYECGITAETADLYWYFFKCDTASEYMFAEKSGDGAKFCENVSMPWQLTVYDNNYTTPEWIKGGLFYHIFVDRFKKAANLRPAAGAIARTDWGGIPNYLPDENGEIKNNDFFGGDLDGVIEKLPYLSELGVTCIYLSPVFEASSNHKYDTADYSSIDPGFGDDETFERLCSEAAALGIHLICDGVFNHTGDDSIYFDRYARYGNNGAFCTKHSPFYSWYTFLKWPEEYESWWGVKTLPRIRWGDGSFREYILGKNGVLKKWMDLGCSGWRLDVADELSEGFIRSLRICAKEHSSDKLIIGEVWEDASNKISYSERRAYLLGAELDCVMNYPLRNGIIDYFLSGDANKLREVVESLCENYPSPSLHCLMNILGTHDTERILTVLGGKTYYTREERAHAKLSDGAYVSAKESLFLATLLQFTLPGVPCVFYGDEAGMQGYEDPFCRTCFPWGNEDTELTEWYKTLARLRLDNDVFCDGSFRSITSENGVFAFERRKGKKVVRIAVNLGPKEYAPILKDKSEVTLTRNCEHNSEGPKIKTKGCIFITEAEGY